MEGAVESVVSPRVRRRVCTRGSNQKLFARPLNFTVRRQRDAIATFSLSVSFRDHNNICRRLLVRRSSGSHSGYGDSGHGLIASALGSSRAQYRGRVVHFKAVLFWVHLT